MASDGHARPKSRVARSAVQSTKAFVAEYKMNGRSAVAGSTDYFFLSFMPVVLKLRGAQKSSQWERGVKDDKFSSAYVLSYRYTFFPFMTIYLQLYNVLANVVLLIFKVERKLCWYRQKGAHHKNFKNLCFLQKATSETKGKQQSCFTHCTFESLTQQNLTSKQIRKHLKRISHKKKKKRKLSNSDQVLFKF